MAPPFRVAWLAEAADEKVARAGAAIPLPVGMAEALPGPAWPEAGLAAGNSLLFHRGMRNQGEYRLLFDQAPVKPALIQRDQPG